MSQVIKVFIVEDNEDERAFMKEGFNASGLYEVVAEAGNGNEMLELFAHPTFSLPEIVLTDLNMPGRDGYEVIADVKTNSSIPDIPVMVVSTAPYIPYADRCKNLGACAFFTKPDTFLEYKEFARRIYSEIVSGCLAK